MKYLILLLSFTLFFSCKNEEDIYNKPESAIDAGRSFIEQSLKGNYALAERYMLKDEENQYWLAKWKEKFEKTSEKERIKFRNASINIKEVSDVVPDSITIINYTNSYTNVLQKIKVSKVSGNWMVDFKYTFSGNL